MLNYPPNLKFSSNLCKKRLEKAYRLLGVRVVHRIIGFALFLLGAKREDIAQYLAMPFGTFLSFLTRIDQCGIFAFVDQRTSPSPQPVIVEKPLDISLNVYDQNFCIRLGDEKQVLTIPRNNLLQCKVVLLTFLNSGLLSLDTISHSLGYSERGVRDLRAKIYEEDVYSLIDKRKGQLQHYRFTPKIKAELIQQFTAHTISGKSTSSRVISDHINQRCNMNLSDRSIRLHIKDLGLHEIKNTLPDLIEMLKKNSTSTS
jgi:hypothetical protein